MSRIEKRVHTPLVSEKQRGLFGAELARRRAGKEDRMSGITEEELARHLRESKGKDLPETTSKLCKNIDDFIKAFKPNYARIWGKEGLTPQTKEENIKWHREHDYPDELIKKPKKIEKKREQFGEKITPVEQLVEEREARGIREEPEEKTDWRAFTGGRAVTRPGSELPKSHYYVGPRGGTSRHTGDPWRRISYRGGAHYVKQLLKSVNGVINTLEDKIVNDMRNEIKTDNTQRAKQLAENISSKAGGSQLLDKQLNKPISYEERVNRAIATSGKKYVRDMGKFLRDVKGKTADEVARMYPEVAKPMNKSFTGSKKLDNRMHQEASKILNRGNVKNYSEAIESAMKNPENWKGYEHLKSINKQVREPYAVATAQVKRMGFTDLSEGSKGAAKRDEIAEALMREKKMEKQSKFLKPGARIGTFKPGDELAFVSHHNQNLRTHDIDYQGPTKDYKGTGDFHYGIDFTPEPYVMSYKKKLLSKSIDEFIEKAGPRYKGGRPTKPGEKTSLGIRRLGPSEIKRRKQRETSARTWDLSEKEPQRSFLSEEY